MSFGFMPYVYVGPVIASTTVLPAVGTALTAIRLYIRIEQEESTGVDDWFAVAALTGFWGMSAIILRGVSHGLYGYPAPPKIPPSMQEELAKLQFAFWVAMILTFGFIKISVVLFYRKVFVIKARRAFNTCTWAALVLSLLWTIACFLLLVLRCGNEPWLAWPTTGPGTAPADKCLNAFKVLLGVAASDFSTDVLVFALPLPVIWTLHMEFAKKLTVTAIIALGSISLLAAVFKLVIFDQAFHIGVTVKVDQNLSITVLYYWSLLEAGTAIIAMNLPTLRQFIGSPPIQSVIISIRSSISSQSLRRDSDRDRALGAASVRGKTTKPQRPDEGRSNNQVEDSTEPTEHSWTNV